MLIFISLGVFTKDGSELGGHKLVLTSLPSAAPNNTLESKEKYYRITNDTPISEIVDFVKSDIGVDLNDQKLITVRTHYDEEEAIFIPFHELTNITVGVLSANGNLPLYTRKDLYIDFEVRLVKMGENCQNKYKYLNCGNFEEGRKSSS